ncbi:hypothetical protein D3C80_1880440 [compost metagenome]
MLNQALGQHFWGVVARRFLARTTGQAIDKGAFSVSSRLTAKQAFGVGVLVDATGGHKVSRIQRVEFGILFLICGAGSFEFILILRVALVVFALIT